VTSASDSCDVIRRPQVAHIDRSTADLVKSTAGRNPGVGKLELIEITSGSDALHSFREAKGPEASLKQAQAIARSSAKRKVA
jgi:hypothetical protein